MKVNRANSRLHPSWFSDRFHILTSLRTQIQSVIDTHLAKRGNVRLVDFGCGSMCYRPLFEPYVIEYIGVDLPGNPQADFHVLPSGETPLPDQFADVVLSTQVLEHVESPSAYLRECHRILKTDGLLILSTHGYWLYHPDPNDYWRWTGSGLRKMLNDEGFYVQDLHGIMGLASAGLQLFQDALRWKIPWFGGRAFAFLMQSFIALADKLHSPSERSEDASVFIVVASKRKGSSPIAGSA